MAQVVVVEGRARARAAALLCAEGIAAEPSAEGIDLVHKAVATHRPSLLIIEVSAMSRSVERLCSSVRSEEVPFAVFPERADEATVLAAFLTGATAVFTEPIGDHELVARTRALLRRAPDRANAEASEVSAVGGVRIDRATRILTVNGTPVALPRREFDIADVLMRRAGLVVSREELVRELWGSLRDTKSLDVQVGRLRTKLTSAEGCQRIVTVRGVGFRFMTDADLESQDADGNELSPRAAAGAP